MNDILILAIDDLQINLAFYNEEYDELDEDDPARPELAKKIETLEKLINELQEKNLLIGEKIEKLEKYINEEIKNIKDWVEATFKTLNHYTDIQALTAIINQLIKEYHAALPNESYEHIHSLINNLETSM